MNKFIRLLVPALFFGSFCWAGDAAPPSRPDRVLYTEIVFEMGQTVEEAMQSLLVDRRLLQEICFQKGGNELRPLPITPEHQPADGSWLIGKQECVINPLFVAANPTF